MNHGCLIVHAGGRVSIVLGERFMDGLSLSLTGSHTQTRKTHAHQIGQTHTHTHKHVHACPISDRETSWMRLELDVHKTIADRVTKMAARMSPQRTGHTTQATRHKTQTTSTDASDSTNMPTRPRECLTLTAFPATPMSWFLSFMPQHHHSPALSLKNVVWPPAERDTQRETQTDTYVRERKGCKHYYKEKNDQAMSKERKREEPEEKMTLLNPKPKS